jgi:hypothetical protein
MDGVADRCGRDRRIVDRRSGVPNQASPGRLTESLRDSRKTDLAQRL